MYLYKMEKDQGKPYIIAIKEGFYVYCDEQEQKKQLRILSLLPVLLICVLVKLLWDYGILNICLENATVFTKPKKIEGVNLCKKKKKNAASRTLEHREWFIRMSTAAGDHWIIGCAENKERTRDGNKDMFAVKTQSNILSCSLSHAYPTTEPVQAETCRARACSSFSSARRRTDRTGSLLLYQFLFVQNDTTKGEESSWITKKDYHYYYYYF